MDGTVKKQQLVAALSALSAKSAVQFVFISPIFKFNCLSLCFVFVLFCVLIQNVLNIKIKWNIYGDNL